MNGSIIRLKAYQINVDFVVHLEYSHISVIQADYFLYVSHLKSITLFFFFHKHSKTEIKDTD